MSTEEVKASILALNLKGKNNIVFFDRKAINARDFHAIAEDVWAVDFEAVFIAVDVPRGKTLRGCVLRRNPLIAKLIRVWGQLTGSNKAQWINEQIKGKP